MNKTEYQPGQLCWVDLASTAPEKVTDFYATLFGWEALPDADDSGGYTMFLIGGGPVAGLVKTHAKGAPSSWNHYTRVNFAGEVPHHAARNGGAVIMEATDFGRTGQAAYVADPEGARVGAWEPGEHRGSVLADEPGVFCFSELATPDLESAQAFYAKLFPWSFYPREGQPYVDVVASGESSFAMRRTEPGEKSAWTIFFGVADLNESLKQVKALRGAVRRPAKDGPRGKTALITDPAGARFGLVEVAPA